ncbi:MAG: MlrC C-terminal domain-containing protein [Gemmataceae bacterium]
MQPWLDIPDLGGVFVVTDNDPARAAAERRRHGGRGVGPAPRSPLLTPVEEAVAAAHRLHGEGLIVLSDSADATTSGAPGDSTWVLRELLRHDWQRPALVTLVAPEVVEEAARLGVGASWAGALGGKRDARFSQPLTLSAEIVRFFDARFTLSGHLAKNLPIDMGRGAVLRHGSVHIVLTSRSGPHFAPALFEAAGLAPFSAGVLVAKSPCGFRAAYQERARQIMLVRAPGCAPSDFWRYEYRHIPRPLWPWDEIETRR